MIQPRTQTRDYWEHEFSLSNKDLEQINNHFLEVEQPQSITEVVLAVIAYHVAEEKSEIKKRLAGRVIFQPKNSYKIDDALVFPAMSFASGKVVAIRDGENPEAGTFKVLTVEMKGIERLFASELESEHALNADYEDIGTVFESMDSAETSSQFVPLIQSQIENALEAEEEYIRLSGQWFIKGLIEDINIGHLHLAEAVLDMSEGGPLSTSDILPHLDLDKSISTASQTFSLNYALLNDNRFDEVAPKGTIQWYLHRFEPKPVRRIPARLRYEEQAYDRALLSTQMIMLERELSDELSDNPVPIVPDSFTFVLTYPHRVEGTLPLNNTIQSMLPIGDSPRQLFTFRDVVTNEEMPIWIIHEGRYIYGLRDWYATTGIPVGGYITLTLTDDPSVVLIDCRRRRKPKKEDIRLAYAEEGQLRFSLTRRDVACDFDDQMVVGTDFSAAIDVFWKKFDKNRRSLVSIMALIMPELADLTPQRPSTQKHCTAPSICSFEPRLAHYSPN